MKPKRHDLSKGVPKANDISHQSLDEIEERPTGTNQSRKVGMMQKSSDFDHNDQINPFTQMESNPCGGSPSTGKGR